MLLSVGIYLALMLGGGSLWGPPRPIDAVRWGALVGPLGRVEPWRYLSAMFVHFSLLHVGFNTLTLHSIGRSLEEGIGSARFVLVFLGTGIAGFVASQVFYELDPLTGGISGGSSVCSAWRSGIVMRSETRNGSASPSPASVMRWPWR